MNIYDLISRAQKLRQETKLDSVSPDRVGALCEDTLKYINEFQLLASSPSLHKIYASVSAMQADKSPKSDLTGKALKPGQLVVIVPANQSDATAGDVYRYDGPSGNTSAWTFVSKIGAVPADAELNATSANPVQNKVVTEKLTELESEIGSMSNRLFNENGRFVMSDGNTGGGSPNVCCTNYLPYKGGDIIVRGYSGSGSTVLMAFYDANKSFLSAIKDASYTGKLVTISENEIPVGTTYVRVTGQAINKKSLPSNFVNLIGLDDLLNSMDKLDAISNTANGNRKEIDNLAVRYISAESSGVMPYDFKMNKDYYIQNVGESAVTISFASEDGVVLKVIGNVYPHTALKVVADSEYNFLKYGNACKLEVYPNVTDKSNEIDYKDFNIGAIANKVNFNEVINVESSDITNCKYIVIPCKKFDKFIITAAGSGNYATYSFTGMNYECVCISEVALNNGVVYAPCDGFLIVNSFSTIAVRHFNAFDAEDKLRSLTKMSFSSDAAASFPYHFVKGKKYVITNNSKHGYQKTFTIRQQESTSVYYNKVNIWGYGGKAIITAEIDANYLRCGDWVDCSVEEYDSYSRRIDDLENAVGNHGKELPAVAFSFDKNFIDCEADLVGMDFSRNDIMEQLYAKYDSLLADNSEYISKVDAVAESGMTYPAYCNLNGVGTTDYKATPSYKLYMYKLVDNRGYANTILKKKKIFIFAGVHGNEIAAPFDLFLFVKNLCESTNEDYFKLRSAFDFYILPCVNGYGMYHGTRGNANKVNVNRNFPVEQWKILGDGTQESAGANDYSGPYAASEFETQLIMKLVDDYNFHFVVDHHNYGHLKWQFYTISSYRRALPVMHESLIDCSYAFIKNLPQYFGSKYKIFFELTDASMPDDVEDGLSQGTSRWAFEQGVELACVIETSQYCNYTNGEYNANGADSFGKDTFGVNEFTLRNMMCHYASLLIGTDL